MEFESLKLNHSYEVQNLRDFEGKVWNGKYILESVETKQIPLVFSLVTVSTIKMSGSYSKDKATKEKFEAVFNESTFVREYSILGDVARDIRNIPTENPNIPIESPKTFVVGNQYVWTGTTYYGLTMKYLGLNNLIHQFVTTVDHKMCLKGTDVFCYPTDIVHIAPVP